MPLIPNQGPAPTAPRTADDVVTTDDVPTSGAPRTSSTPTAKDATVPAKGDARSPQSSKDAPGTERRVKGT